jgi:Protein of unknown function (DUF998)
MILQKGARTMNRLVMFIGVLGALWVLGLTVIGGALSPGYDHSSQFISELGAKGAPYAKEINLAGFLPAGILIASFAVLAWWVLPRSWSSMFGMLGIGLFAMGYLVAAFFQCDEGCRPEQPSFDQTVHSVFGLIGYLTAPLTLFVLGWSARTWPNGLGMAMLGWLCGAAALGALVSVFQGLEHVGVNQRVLEASVLSWVAACGLYIGARS